MIYVITYSMAAPNMPMGVINGLFEDAFIDSRKAEMTFDNLILNHEFQRKELWLKDDLGRRRLLKEVRYEG